MDVRSCENLLDKLLGAKSPFVPSLHLFTPTSILKGKKTESAHNFTFSVIPSKSIIFCFLCINRADNIGLSPLLVLVSQPTGIRMVLKSNSKGQKGGELPRKSAS